MGIKYIRIYIGQTRKHAVWMIQMTRRWPSGNIYCAIEIGDENLYIRYKIWVSEKGCITLYKEFFFSFWLFGQERESHGGSKKYIVELTSSPVELPYIYTPRLFWAKITTRANTTLYFFVPLYKKRKLHLFIFKFIYIQRRDVI